MLDKTKAAMRGRQCSTENKEQGQHTRLVAGGQSLTAPVITGTTPLARLMGDLAHRVNNFYSALRVTKSHAHLQTTQKLGCLGCTALQHTPYLSRGVGCEPVAHTLLLQTSLGVVQTSPLRSPVLVSSNIGYQLFGSMPLCFNSFRTIRLSHAERVASPSSCMAATIASSSAGSTRKAICLLPLGILMFDMCLTLGVIFVVSSNVHHVSDTCKARSPVVLPALTGPLTTNRYTR